MRHRLTLPILGYRKDGRPIYPIAGGAPTEAEQIDARRTEVDERLKAILAEMNQISGHEKLTGAQTRRASLLDDECGELISERDALDARTVSNTRRAELGEVIRAGLADGSVRFERPVGPDGERPDGERTTRTPAASFRGDPWSPDQPLSRNTPVELRGRALTAIERSERIPDAARQVATLAVEQDDDKLSRLAQYTIVASDPNYFSAFRSWFNDTVTGPHGWSPAERGAYRAVSDLCRAMNIGTTTAGGFLTPYELDPQILISGSGSVNPMRDVSRIAQTVVNEKRFITSAGVTASWDAEAAEVSDDSPTLAQPPVVCYKGAAYVQSSYELDEDSDLAQQVGMLFADAKAQLEANAFTLGTGVAQPKGIITALVAAGGASVITSALTLLSLVDIIANQNALPPRWRPNAKWMANLSMINAARQIPLYANGPSIVNDSTTPPRCLGWDLIENSSMDGTIAAGTTADYVWLSGDFRQYAIVDRLGTMIVPVPVVVGANRRPTGERGWYLHWRTGADVLIPTAFELTNYSG